MILISSDPSEEFPVVEIASKDLSGSALAISLIRIGNSL